MPTSLDNLTYPLVKASRMVPELDEIGTVVAFAAIIAVGIGGLYLMPVGMTTETILTMVLPSMIVFGALMLLIGIAHGKYRA